MTDPQAFTAVKRAPELEAILASLDSHAILADGAQRPAGGGFPGDDASQQFVPYAVVYPGVTLDIDGPVSDPNADTLNEYLVHSFGETLLQAVWVSDQVRGALLRGLVVTGRHVQLVEWTGSREGARDDSIVPPVFLVIDMYTVSSSPA